VEKEKAFKEQKISHSIVEELLRKNKHLMYCENAEKIELLAAACSSCAQSFFSVTCQWIFPLKKYSSCIGKQD
jgi:hypothetical protein